MKLALFILFLSASLYSIAQAQPNARKNSRSHILLNEDEERYVMLTGSNIPQKVRMKSIGTAIPYNFASRLSKNS